MKESELRLGNWVGLYAGDTIVCQEHKIVVSDFEHIEALCLVGFRPIPLTEELLLRLGLKKMLETEYTLNTYEFAGFKLWIHKGKFLFDSRIEINYVHQLQNLYFALTGKELEWN